MARRDTALKYFNEQKDWMDYKIKTGTELNRKGDLEIRFVGDTVPEEITVEAEQTSHAFRFGANLLMLDEFETEEKNLQYRKKFPEIFNLATVPFYWNTLEPEEGKPRFSKDSPKIYRRPAPDLCVEYCEENHIEPKCHCLNYDFFTPDWVRCLPVNEIKKKLEKRFREIAERYADKIPSFEVTNETLRTYVPKLCSPFFSCDDIVEWSFRTADKYFPSNRLIINEAVVWTPEHAGNRRTYYMQIERLLRNGISHLDSIGLQFHSFRDLEDEPILAAQRYNPQEVYELLDTYGRFGLPEQITEMTIPAYGNDPENEEIQAILLENVYRIFFSHAAMEGIIYWNVPDGYAHSWEGGDPNDMTTGENRYFGGLLRRDLSEKPTYKVLKKLICDEWHTKTTAVAKDGKARFRGFYGDYKLKIYAGGKEIPVTCKLSKSAYNQITIKL